jgi:hypothetical protein
LSSESFQRRLLSYGEEKAKKGRCGKEGVEDLNSVAQTLSEYLHSEQGSAGKIAGEFDRHEHC